MTFYILVESGYVCAVQVGKSWQWHDFDIRFTGSSHSTVESRLNSLRMGLLYGIYLRLRNFLVFFLLVALIPGVPPKTHFDWKGFR